MSTNNNPSWMKKPAATPASTEESPVNNSSRNAVRHGCCAVDATLLPTESAADFKALEQTWFRAYTPKTEAECHLVQELVNADWLLQRATRAYLKVEHDTYVALPDPTEWTEEHQSAISRFLRYKTAHANNVNKCRKAIDDYRKARLNETAIAEKLTIAKDRLKLAEKKANKTEKTEPTWKEHLENMRQQAISMGFRPPDRDPTKR